MDYKNSHFHSIWSIFVLIDVLTRKLDLRLDKIYFEDDEFVFSVK